MARKLDLKEQNPALQRIADMLVKAFNDIGERIRTDLLKAYRNYALESFKSFMKAIEIGAGPLKTDIYGREEWRDWHEYADLKTVDTSYSYSTRKTWEDYKKIKHLFSVSYKKADRDANDSYENARDSFVHKNLDKLRNVLGSRTDLKNAVIKFDWRGGYFKGNIQIYLEDAYFRGDVDIKYVIRRIPRVTPYFQYPLLFVEADVKGKHYAAPSEDELRVLLGATKTAVEEKKEAAVAAGVCPMSGQYVPEALLKGLYNRMSVYVKCPTCSAVASVNKQSWKFRNHKTPGAERAGAATKLESAGYCGMSREKVPADVISDLGPVDGYKDPKAPCKSCGQQVRIDSRREWIRDRFVNSQGYPTKMVVESATYYKHKLAK